MVSHSKADDNASEKDLQAELDDPRSQLTADVIPPQHDEPPQGEDVKAPSHDEPPQGEDVKPAGAGVDKIEAGEKDDEDDIAPRKVTHKE
jgi:hypothetical protein